MENDWPAFKSEFMLSLQQRGYLHQCSNATELDNLAASGQLIAYTGYDMTAKSLHVGNLISIMMLRRLQQAGGKPIIVLGGGTTRIGDPSGRDESRLLLSEDQIAENKSAIEKTFKRFLKFGDRPTDAIMVDNYDWLRDLNYISFLRDIGSHFSVNRMLSFDSVRLRLEREQPLSFIEFNYMILQAYDFVELFKKYNCRLQMGGSDQWGNIVNGIELGRRTAQAELFGLTTALLTTSSGAKMGKTAQGAVWLSETMLSPYDYWQFWRNTEDADVIRFLALFTDLPQSEIDGLAKLSGAEINQAKIILATEATRLAHGDEAANAAAATASKTFGAEGRDDNLPAKDIDKNILNAGLGLLEAFVMVGFASSNGEARRLIQNGGARVNDEVESDIHRILTIADIENDAIKLSAGKKRHALIRLRP